MKCLILGGTGTLGQALTKSLLAEHHPVTCFSRDELKQSEMKKKFKSGGLDFIIGDIRDRDHLFQVFNGYDAIFHVAALKHVDTLEDNPEESIKTNVLGTMNVADAAIANRVKYVAFSSTDKAVDPVNAYGMSKGLSEKILLSRNSKQKHTLFSVYRWGNVINSRGSVIPYFSKTLRENQVAYITDINMSRFWVKIEDAVNFMISTFTEPGDVKIPPMKAATVRSIVEAVATLHGIGRFDIQYSGPRKGEKIHESIVSRNDKYHISSETHDQFTKQELFKLLKPVLEAPL